MNRSLWIFPRNGVRPNIPIEAEKNIREIDFTDKVEVSGEDVRKMLYRAYQPNENILHPVIYDMALSTYREKAGNGTVESIIPYIPPPPKQASYNGAFYDQTPVSTTKRTKLTREFPANGLLFILGAPGSGKSTLAMYLAQNMNFLLISLSHFVKLAQQLPGWVDSDTNDKQQLILNAIVKLIQDTPNRRIVIDGWDLYGIQKLCDRIERPLGGVVYIRGDPDVCISRLCRSSTSHSVKQGAQARVSAYFQKYHDMFKTIQVLYTCASVALECYQPVLVNLNAVKDYLGCSLDLVKDGSCHLEDDDITTIITEDNR